MATALIDYHQQKYDALVSQRQTTQLALKAANTALASARANQSVLAGTSAELSAAIGARRAQLANPNLMPADIEALAAELQALLISRRHNNADLLEAEAIIADNVAQFDVLTPQLARLHEAVTQAAGELAAAEQRGEQHAAWLGSDTVDAVTALQAAAQTLLDVEGGGPVEADSPSATLAAAKARVDGDIPDALRDLARLRAEAVVMDVELQAELAAGLDALVQAQARSVAADAGLVAQRRAEYAAAEAALKNHALGLRDEFSRALGLLTAVASSPALTVAERSRITALALADDSDAITTANELVEAQAAVAAKRQDLQLAIAAARAADINADPYDDSSVQSEQSELDTREATLVDAVTAHTDAFADALDEWEGAVPDAIWANLHNYDQAIAALERVVDSDGATLASEFAAAETALIAALVVADDHQRLTLLLWREQALAAARAQQLQASAATRQLAAARGDY